MTTIQFFWSTQLTSITMSSTALCALRLVAGSTSSTSYVVQRTYRILKHAGNGQFTGKTDNHSMLAHGSKCGGASKHFSRFAHARAVSTPYFSASQNNMHDAQKQGGIPLNSEKLVDLDDEFIDDGSLALGGAAEAAEADITDDIEVIPHRQRPAYYDLQIKALTTAKRLDEALRFFDIRMKQQDKVPPSWYVYSRLISSCGTVGYLDRAFELYNEMKGRHYIRKKKNHPEIVSSLFNACAECPFKEKGLLKAKYLFERLLSEQYTFDVPNYNAVMKAFARHGDLVSAFGIVDRMEAEGLARDAVTIQTLLSACLSDKKAGFKLAIDVWRQAHKRRAFKFDNFHYQILLRIVRECGVGDNTFAQELIANKSKKSQQELLLTMRNAISSGGDVDGDNNSTEKNGNGVDNSRILASSHPSSVTADLFANDTQQNSIQDAPDLAVTDDSHFDSSVAEGTNSVSLVTSTINKNLPFDTNDSNSPVASGVRIPDILQNRLRYDATLKLGALDSPPSRLALLGGVEGVIHRMQLGSLRPDAVIFNELLQSIESTLDHENNLMTVMRQYKIPMDVSFFNLLLSKRVKRRDKTGASDALRLMHHHFLAPTQQTFGCLAMLCASEVEAEELFAGMACCDVAVNGHILSPMLSNALIRCNFSYFSYPVSTMTLMHERLGYAPPVAIRSLEIFFDKHLRLIKRFEMMQPEERRRQVAENQNSYSKGERQATFKDVFLYDSESFLHQFYRFKQFYFMWLKRIQAQQPSNPWKRFQEHLNDDNEEHVVPDKKRVS